MITIPGVLDAGVLAHVRAIVEGGEWDDGNATSGAQSALAKRNEQLAEDSAAARQAGGIVLDALSTSALFVAAALPLKVYPPLFSRYGDGQAFGAHVDNAIRIRRGSDFRIRADMSATLFLSDPEGYDGGELVIADAFDARRVKLAAGDMVLYSASSIHHVEAVAGGTRLAAVFWLQSMVRDDAARRDLLDLDRAVQSIAGRLGQDDAEVIRLTGVYHNLLRRWAEV